MPLRLSENVRTIEPSATIAVSTLAKRLRAEGRDIIDLSAGEPDFATPAPIAEAAVQAIREGFTRYTPAPGLPELRAAIASEMARTTGRSCDPAGVVVTAGAKQALFNACFSLFGPGDRVLLPVPYWTSYPEMLRLARAEPIEVRGPRERGFKVGPRELDAAAGGGARGLILNSPANPHGSVYTRDELRAILEWAAGRGVWIVSDEIYGRICYTEPRAPGLLDLEGDLLEHAVVIDGASKVFAMTGWRIGYSYSRPDLAERMAAVQSHMTSNASTPSQYAAIAAFSREAVEGEAVRAMLAAFARRRELVLSLVEELLPGAEFVRPDGAFYLFLRTDAFYDDGAPDSIAFCSRLLERTGVALVPGAAFGDDRYVRLSFAAADEVLEDGLRRLAASLGAAAHDA